MQITEQALKVAVSHFHRREVSQLVFEKWQSQCCNKVFTLWLNFCQNRLECPTLFYKPNKNWHQCALWWLKLAQKKVMISDQTTVTEACFALFLVSSQKGKSNLDFYGSSKVAFRLFLSYWLKMFKGVSSIAKSC